MVVHSCAANQEPACLLTQLLTMTTAHKFQSLESGPASDLPGLLGIARLQDVLVLEVGVGVVHVDQILSVLLLRIVLSRVSGVLDELLNF